MTKGVNALEIVFGMFLLLIVVFVVIRLITTFVTPNKVTGQLQSFEEANRYSEEKSRCKSLCDEYTTEDCNRMSAVNYCIHKLNLDIDGNKKSGEKGHGGFVAKLPYCEDGLYCFHIYSCSCGSYTLTAENCRKILCEFYVRDKGLDPNVPGVDRGKIEDNIVKLIQANIDYGTCDPDPNKWPYENIQVADLKACWWAYSANYYEDSECKSYSKFDKLCGDVI